MRSRTILPFLRNALTIRPNFNINHIKNMNEQNMRVIAEKIEN